MAGPFCCQLLGDMGADVIKVGPPRTGDQARHAMGFAMKGEDTAAFLAVNRNKRSIALDLKDDEQRAVFHRLAATADVVVENFRPGVTGRLGIDPETLRARDPRLIYASISGFGQTGPSALRPGYDLIAQGVAGLMSVTGEPGGDPVKCGVPVSDLSAGPFFAGRGPSPLHAPERPREGPRTRPPPWGGAPALPLSEPAELGATGKVPGKLGSAHRLTAPYQAFKTRDGHLTVGGNNQKLWERLCATIGRPELVEEFPTNADRMARRPELARELEAALTRRDTEEWVDI